MWFKASIVFIATVIQLKVAAEDSKPVHIAIVGNPLAHFLPCNNDYDIIIAFESGRAPEEENQYHLSIRKKLYKHSQINMKFDSEAIVTLEQDDPPARITSKEYGVFNLRFFKPSTFVYLNVKGPITGTVPYLESLQIDTMEFCDNHTTGYLDDYIIGYRNTAHTSLSLPDSSCGRRKIDYTELIVNADPTRPGDWPWHAAILRFNGGTVKYICGGTLISKTIVLTAAHCATIQNNPVLPEILSVVLGKYNLIGGDVDAQERQVHEVIVHKEYRYNGLLNDIALLKLKSEVVYTDYVQPACLWQSEAYEKLPVGQVYGTVVGWGFDQNDKLAPTLQQTLIPKVSEAACVKSNPVFFSKVLNNRKFCAGWNNGTSPCNGDSGGGFSVFVPDQTGDAAKNATGAYYVHGIVSLSVRRQGEAICDPFQYTVFTDVASFRSWIDLYVKQ